MSLLRGMAIGAILSVLGLVSNANATYITSGQIITDDTIGLEWLQLRATTGLTYGDAFTVNQADGWRYATNNEVVDMFNYFFPTFVPNNLNGASIYTSRSSSYTYSCGTFGTSTCYGSSSSSTPDSAYARAQQDADISNWRSIFYTTNSYYGSYSSGSSTTGLYRDELGILREINAGSGRYSSYSSWGSSSSVAGPDYTLIHEDSDLGTMGTFLVRTNAVPEPASIALMGLGLVGLGFARRKKAA